MTAPGVSIVLPTYNGSRYLSESIQSCLDQTYTDFELIIVDDCSTDSTPQIIADFMAKDPRVQSVRNDPNRKLPSSLNRGFSLTRGRYLTWTSDDNLFRPEALAELVAVLDREPDVGLVYTPSTYIDTEGKVTGPSCSGWPPDTLAYRNPVGPSFMYRREVYEAVGDYSEELFLVEDWDYWMRVAEKFRLHVLPKDLYLYRLHNESLSRTKLDKVRRVTRELLERYLPRMHWASRSAKAHGYLIAARIAWENGDRGVALRHIGRAVGMSPTYALGRFASEPFDRLLKRRHFREHAR